MLRVKVIAKFQNLNVWQIFGICNFEFVLLWHGIWYESIGIVWVIMGRLGYSQNGYAGVLVVPVSPTIKFHPTLGHATLNSLLFPGFLLVEHFPRIFRWTADLILMGELSLWDHLGRIIFLSCGQAPLWMVRSARPSVRPSVRLSHLFDNVPVIVSSWNFQEWSPLTKVVPMQKVKVRGQRSRSQMVIKTQFSSYSNSSLQG